MSAALGLVQLGRLDEMLAAIDGNRLAGHSSRFEQIPRRGGNIVRGGPPPQYGRLLLSSEMGFALALVPPVGVSRYELERRLTGAHELVESVTYFDVYGGSTLPPGTRSLTFNIRLSSSERTLTDSDILEGRTALLAAAATVGAVLR